MAINISAVWLMHAPNNSHDGTIEVKSRCSDGCNNFSDMTIGTEEAGSVSDSSGDRSTTEDHVEDGMLPSEIVFTPWNNAPSSSPLETDRNLAVLEDWPIPKGKSIAHHYLNDEGTVSVHLILRLEGSIVGSSNFQPRFFVLQISIPKLPPSQKVPSSTSTLNLLMVPSGIKIQQISMDWQRLLLNLKMQGLFGTTFANSSTSKFLLLKFVFLLHIMTAGAIWSGYGNQLKIQIVLSPFQTKSSFSWIFWR